MFFCCKDIKKSFGSNVVLNNISFNLEKNEKAAIVGVNGAGKSTLFKIICGELYQDFGEISISPGIMIGHFSQDLGLDCSNSIYDELLSAFNYLIEMEKELADVEASLARLDGELLAKQLTYYSKLRHKFEELDGYAYKSKVRGVVNGLGFADGGDRKINMLSGGEKTRVCLGKLLLSESQFLLLDEPTNHLDIASVNYLEDFLKSSNKAMLVISHDRFFIDNVCSKIIEIENNNSYVYNGNYSFYIKQKELINSAHQKNYNDQQKYIKKQKETISTLRSFNREKSIKRAESREKMLAKLDIIEKPKNAPASMRLSLEPKRESGNDVLQVRDISFAYSDTPLLTNISFDVVKGDKIALIGANGIGKTTLLKILLGEIKQKTGTVKFGANVRIAYYDQEHQSLDEGKTIFSEIADTYPKLTEGEIRNKLAAFVFCGDDIYKSINTLSGGEKGRLLLAKLMLSGANFLIFDEPTNHLDLFSKEILEDAINGFNATVLYISHDRYFINRTAIKVLELSYAGVSCFLGDYTYYINKKAEILHNTAAYEQPSKKETQSENKDIWRKKKEDASNERKRQTLIKKIESDIEKLEQEIADCERQLCQPEIYADSIKAKEVHDTKLQLEQTLVELYEQWEDVFV